MARAGIGDRVEGTHAVAAAAEAGRIVELFVEKSRTRRPEVQAIVERVRAIGGSVQIVPSVRSMARTDAPQGVIADATPIEPVSVEDLAGQGAAVLVLDHIEDPHNVGAAARSALAAGMTGLVVPERRGAPLGAVAFKAAAGALERLPIALISSVADGVDRLKRRNVWTVGLDADGDQSLFGLPLLSEPVAIVVGAEGEGLGRLVRERVDVVATIPMAGPMESLNASVAAALAAFEIQRVRSA
jgi:23S rRNA (guanosine2251-2'-O)-methyltransferase